MIIKNSKNNEIIAEHIKIAYTFLVKAIGLLFHKNLDDNAGLLFKNCIQIHTFFMKFPIDVIFCDKDKRIIKIYHNLKPFSITGIHFKSYIGFVLELNAGVAHKKDLVCGDFLVF